MPSEKVYENNPFQKNCDKDSNVSDFELCNFLFDVLNLIAI